MPTPGQPEQFFLVVPPGFENLAVAELNEKLPGLQILSTDRGGVLVEAPFELGLAFNTSLKIPTAVRLRIAEFKSRDFLRLFNRIQSVRWNSYLMGNAFELSVECAQSRLNHEKRVEKTVRDGIARFFEKQPPKKVANPIAFVVHVRFFDDLCTLSLDLSGEPLFKRGYKVMSGAAPLRENLAAGLFYALWVQSRATIETLIDPMCGTGTLLLEAQSFFTNSRHRSFAFESQKEWVAAEIPSGDRGPKSFYGFDRSEANLEKARGSLSAAGGDAELWHFEKHDVFASKPPPINGTPEGRALVCNPPYGERIKLPEKPSLYYPSLFEQLVKFECAHIGAVIPKDSAKFWPQTARGYKPSATIAFSNGGIPVEFRVHSR